jgi:hypothetical protein
MTIKEVITKYLKDNSYDGLAGNNCGCGVDDLMPCDCPDLECKVAKRHNCLDCPDKNSGCESEDREFTLGCWKPAEVAK